ncbi:MAG TPA: molybdopterin-guanine dinucleotide biosynthesis protein B [Anaeromyxobacteraceae bacterium]
MSRRGPPPILAFSGASGAGKTRLLVRLLPRLRARGLRVCALKHTGHAHALDRRGRDTERLRRAGALAAAIEGPGGLALFGPAAGGARAMARLLPPCDLVVAEGFRSEPLPRVEVRRRAVDPGWLCARDRRVLAVVADEPPPRALPCFGAGEVEALADFVAAFARGGRAARRARGRIRQRR